MILQGKCRNCRQTISPLYPLFEIATALVFTLVFFTIPLRFIIPGYLVWLSALLINARTDLDELLIPRLSSIALVPIMWLFATYHQLPITAIESVTASICCYAFFWIIGTTFKKTTGYQGLGEGDYDLFALIGAGIGFIGSWFTLLSSSLLGVLFGLVVGQIKGNYSQVKLPFAPFLVAGAIMYVMLYRSILPLIFRFCS